MKLSKICNAVPIHGDAMVSCPSAEQQQQSSLMNQFTSEGRLCMTSKIGRELTF